MGTPMPADHNIMARFRGTGGRNDPPCRLPDPSTRPLSLSACGSTADAGE